VYTTEQHLYVYIQILTDTVVGSSHNSAESPPRTNPCNSTCQCNTTNSEYYSTRFSDSGVGKNVCSVGMLCTGWRRLIGCLKFQVIFRKRATNYRALLRKMSCEDKASYGSSPPCTVLQLENLRTPRIPGGPRGRSVFALWRRSGGYIYICIYIYIYRQSFWSAIHV